MRSRTHVECGLTHLTQHVTHALLITHTLDPYFIHSISHQLSHSHLLVFAQGSCQQMCHVTNCTATTQPLPICLLHRSATFLLWLKAEGIFTDMAWAFCVDVDDNFHIPFLNFISDHCFALSYHRWSCFQVVEC
jgi:hypothetical protein